jgi:hypothetical protein
LFNLLVTYNLEDWDLNPYEYDSSRFCEYTIPEIKDRFKTLNEDVRNQLKEFCCLFMSEGESAPSRIGYIKDIKVKTQRIKIKYNFDPIFPPIPSGEIAKLKMDLDIEDFELFRTHWAIKDEDLVEVLLRQKLIIPEQVESSYRLRNGVIHNRPSLDRRFDKTKIFIVHGRDNSVKSEMARFIEQLGLESIILHEQANQGMTIIEKIEAYSDVGFAVVLYTPCDVGALSSKSGELNSRARQNVVFEHGFLMGKLGRDKVAAFVKRDVELPTDINGIVYIDMDDEGGWKGKLLLELRNVGYDVDMNRIF